MKKYYKRFKNWMAYNPPGALTSKGWRLFKKEFQERAPVRFWFSNTLRYKLTLPIKWKVEKVTSWIRYRTYDKYHVINTGLKPNYYGIEERILHVNFNMLKDFVEKDLAWRDWCVDEKIRDNLSFVQRFVPCGLYISPYKNPERGIKHLEWEATLDDPTLPPYQQSIVQAQTAREKLILYRWWVIDRPARVPIEIGTYGPRNLDLDIFDDDFDKESPSFKEYEERIRKSGEQDLEWIKEDEEMLVRLIKIREYLWT